MNNNFNNGDFIFKKNDNQTTNQYQVFNPEVGFNFNNDEFNQADIPPELNSIKNLDDSSIVTAPTMDALDPIYNPNQSQNTQLDRLDAYENGYGFNLNKPAQNFNNNSSSYNSGYDTPGFVFQTNQDNFSNNNVLAGNQTLSSGIENSNFMPNYGIDGNNFNPTLNVGIGMQSGNSSLPNVGTNNFMPSYGMNANYSNPALNTGMSIQPGNSSLPSEGTNNFMPSYGMPSEGTNNFMPSYGMNASYPNPDLNTGMGMQSGNFSVPNVNGDNLNVNPNLNTDYLGITLNNDRKSEQGEMSSTNNLDTNFVSNGAMNTNFSVPQANDSLDLNYSATTVDKDNFGDTTDYNTSDDKDLDGGSRTSELEDLENKNNEENETSDNLVNADNIKESEDGDESHSLDDLGIEESYKEPDSMEIIDFDSDSGEKVSGNSLEETITTIKQLIKELEEKGIKIEVEEFDFEKLYQIIIKIEK